MTAALVVVPSARSQSIDDVHVAPRTTDEMRSVASRETTEILDLRANSLRVDVDLVLVPVTVVDRSNRVVDTLAKQNFSLFEETTQQDIKYFSVEDTPISVGLIVDLSGSMANKTDELREAIQQFFANANPQDDYFVVTVSDTPKLLADTTQSISTIQAKLSSMPPGGFTALLDGIYLAESKLRSARYDRKALVIISDGGDNVSRYTLHEIKNLVQEADAEIYAIGLFDGVPVFRTLEERFGRHLLEQVTDSTGGRTLGVNNLAKLPQAAATVSRELRTQYILGYHPTADKRDSKWRKITVKVTPNDKDRQLQAFYKKGYAGPGN